VFKSTGEEEWIFAGVSWLRDGHTDVITWNCFVDGNATGPIPWNNWDMHFNNNTKSIGFVLNEKEWGFYVGELYIFIKCNNIALRPKFTFGT
jgi:hypothetical protein